MPNADLFLFTKEQHIQKSDVQHVGPQTTVFLPIISTAIQFDCTAYELLSSYHSA